MNPKDCTWAYKYSERYLLHMYELKAFYRFEFNTLGTLVH